MRKKIKALLKNQKGFTLVELLAVIVILGIIGAIAVPSIAGIIDNSKKDAHIANAQQMVSAARLAVAANDTTTLGTDQDTVATTETYDIDLAELVSGGYMEQGLIDPDSSVAYTSTTLATGSYVHVVKTVGIGAGAGTITYQVALDGRDRGIPLQDPTTITRADVQ